MPGSKKGAPNQDKTHYSIKTQPKQLLTPALQLGIQCLDKYDLNFAYKNNFFHLFFSGDGDGVTYASNTVIHLYE